MSKNIPLLTRADGYLEQLPVKELGLLNKYKYASPPQGVAEAFGAVVWLLAGSAKEVEAGPDGRPRAADWRACLALLRVPEDLLATLRLYYQLINADQAAAANLEQVRREFVLPFREGRLEIKHKAARALLGWVGCMTDYWESVNQLLPTKTYLNAQLA
jgi:hypothetical protein